MSTIRLTCKRCGSSITTASTGEAIEWDGAHEKRCPVEAVIVMPCGQELMEYPAALEHEAACRICRATGPTERETQS